MDNELKKLVIGLGTGRCGTVSLSALLYHYGFDTTHENFLLPWNIDEKMYKENMNLILSRENNYVADSAFYYLPYIPMIIKDYPSVKCICLQRDKKETIESYMVKTHGRNHWSKKHNDAIDPKWDVTYPKFDESDKEKALGLYWDYYYTTTEQLVKEYPNNIALFDMHSVLNTKEGQEQLLTFLNLPFTYLKLGIKKNT